MLKALDGIQGPLNIGTGCFFSRKALYGYVPCFESETPNTSWWDSRKKSSNDSCGPYAHGIDESSSILSTVELYNLENEIPSNLQSLERCLGQSRLLIASNFVKDGRLPLSASSDEILGEAIHVTSLDYEDNTAWGREIGWIYGSQTGDILTGFKMHVRGWRSIYCMPTCAAFRGPAPINLSVRLNHALLGATGSIEILFSRHCPIWYGCGARLKLLERIAYISAILYPLTSIPLLIYCTLPAICLLSGKFIISPITYQASIWIMLILLSVLANAVLEVRWSGVSLKEWWRNQQFWVIAGVSSHFFAILKGVRRVVLSSNTSSGVKTKAFSKNNAMEFYALKWTSLLVLPTTVLLVNLLAMVAGIFSALTTGYYASLRVLSAELFFATGVILHLFPFLKALSDRNRIPTIVIIWSLLIASIFSVLWVRMDPFTTRFRGPDIEDCGVMC